MTTPAKTEANRKNALRSTGPKTPEGKARSSKNAIRHGLLSKETLLPDEKREDLEDFRDRLRGELRPVGELEELLADRVVSSAWRLRRALRTEVEVLQRNGADFVDDETPVDLALAHARDSNKGGVLPKLVRYESALERSLYRALHELERLRESRGGRLVPPPVVVDVEGIQG